MSVDTHKLLEIRGKMFHLMMCSWSEESGGYNIQYYPQKVDAELAWRKERL